MTNRLRRRAWCRAKGLQYARAKEGGFTIKRPKKSFGIYFKNPIVSDDRFMEEVEYLVDYRKIY